MTNKSATNLRDVGIIATIVLVSVILLKFSSKDDSIKIAPAGASAAAVTANQSVVNPSSQIAGDFKEESSNLTDTFQAMPEGSSESIANALEPFWTVSRAIDDDTVTDVPLEIEATSDTSGVSEPIDYSGSRITGAVSSGQGNTGVTTTTGGGSGGTGDSSSGNSSSGGATGGAGTSGDSTSSGSGSTDAVSSGQDSTGATTTTGGGGGGSSNSTPVIVLSSLEKVLQDDVNVNGAKEAEIFCAKNEYESFQIIIVNPTDTPISQINLKTDNWHFTDTPGEGSPELTLYREHYVKVDRPSYNLKSKLGMYPDALIPFIDPYTGKEIVNAKYLARNQDVESHRSQGYWIDVHVGGNVKAGIYTNEIKVLAGERVIGRIPVKLTVWDFELPKYPAWTAYFGGLTYLNNAYGLTNPSVEYDTLRHRHATFLYEHGIYPNVLKHPSINMDTGDVTFTADYIASLRAFVNEFGARVLKIPQLATNDPRALSKYFAAYDAFSIANPWAGQYFFYIDEPHTLEQYNLVKQCGDIIHAYASSIKLLVTIDNPPQPTWPNLDDVIDTEVLLFRIATPANIQKYHDLNKDVWSYTALTGNSLKWELDSNLIDYRIPAWCSYSLDIKGFLYWTTMVWTGTSHGASFDPWLISKSYTTQHGESYNGEGLLIYPGTEAGIFGPVASMRLKVFRDSVEDYDYLKLLESLTSRGQAVSQASSIAKDFVTYDKNPESYIAKRKAVAEMILNQMGKK
jgi:hypothetical protein